MDLCRRKRRSRSYFCEPDRCDVEENPLEIIVVFLRFFCFHSSLLREIFSHLLTDTQGDRRDRWREIMPLCGSPVSHGLCGSPISRVFEKETGQPCALPRLTVSKLTATNCKLFMDRIMPHLLTHRINR